MKIVLSFPTDTTEAEALQLLRDALGEFYQKREPPALYVHGRYGRTALDNPKKVVQVHRRVDAAKHALITMEVLPPPLLLVEEANFTPEEKARIEQLIEEWKGDPAATPIVVLPTKGVVVEDLKLTGDLTFDNGTTTPINAEEAMSVVERLEELDVDMEQLDEMVHEAAGQMASGINNSSMPEQVQFLLNYGVKPEEIISVAIVDAAEEVVP